ncbi:MAG: phosphoribosylformylglycinamidine synthase, partial [Desulfobacca sp.]|nr:phosphoribosylformylglycinamidine synthase [Desulfobacca sp.]
MPDRLEILLKPELRDPEGETLKKKTLEYLGVKLERVRTIQVLTFDTSLTQEQLEAIRTEIFTNPVTQISSFQPLAQDFDWLIWVGLRPGVKDNAGSTAIEAIEAFLEIKLPGEEGVYTSRQYLLKVPRLKREAVERIARELLANELIQQWRVFSRADWDSQTGIGWSIPKVALHHQPTVSVIPIDSLEEFSRINRERSWALPLGDMPVIQAYFQRPEVLEARNQVGLTQPTDVELEYVSQAR